MRAEQTADSSHHSDTSVEDVFGEWAERHEAELSCGKIAARITTAHLPTLVMRLAVAFDDQPTRDEEVDPPDAVDLNLSAKRHTELSQDQPHECLRAGFGTPVDEPQYRSVSLRQGREHLVHLQHG